jgi:hypothetical protein
MSFLPLELPRSDDLHWWRFQMGSPTITMTVPLVGSESMVQPCSRRVTEMLVPIRSQKFMKTGHRQELQTEVIEINYP